MTQVATKPAMSESLYGLEPTGGGPSRFIPRRLVWGLGFVVVGWLPRCLWWRSSRFRQRRSWDVRIYRWNGSAWQQEGSTLMGFLPAKILANPFRFREIGAALLLVQTMAAMRLYSETMEPIGSRSAKQFVVKLLAINLDGHCPCPLMAKQFSSAGLSRIPTASTPVMPWFSGYLQTVKNGCKLAKSLLERRQTTDLAFLRLFRTMAELPLERVETNGSAAGHVRVYD